MTRTINAHKWVKLYNRQNGRCYYCLQKFDTKRNGVNALKKARELMKDKTKIGYRIEVLEIDTFPCDCEDDEEKIKLKEQITKPLG